MANSAWVYGSLLIGNEVVWICWESRTGKFDMIAVNPETVCQSVNYPDVYNKVLFEGDIIESYFGRTYVILLTHKGIKAKCEIGFLYDIEMICKPILIGNIYDVEERA